MAEIELISTSLPDLLPMQNRSPGLHVTDIIKDLCIRRGYFEAGELNMNRLQFGCAVEDMISLRYSQQYPGRYIQLGELTLDGIHGTSDLWDCLLDEPNEFKATWQSSRHDPRDPNSASKFFYPRMQLGSYAKMTDSTSGVLTRVHPMGDWKGFEVHVRSWRFKWSDREVNTMWDIIRNHRDLMERELRNGEP